MEVRIYVDPIERELDLEILLTSDDEGRGRLSRTLASCIKDFLVFEFKDRQAPIVEVEIV